MKRDVIFAFIGGIVVGASAAVTYMKRSGYTKLSGHDRDVLCAAESSDKKTSLETENETEKLAPTLRDVPSFEISKKLDTHKVRYDGVINKPSLDEVSKKYQDSSYDRHMSEREHPEEDGIDDNDEFDETEDPDYEGPIYGDESVEEREMADAMPYEDDDIDYSHTIMRLQGRRKNDLIYLVPQDHAGEIFPLEDLNYYAKDDVLCDITDAPVDDPMSVIGDSLGYFGQYGADSDKLFVRNCTIGFEYEVTLIDGRYAEHLYGISSEEMKGESIKVKKSKKVRIDEE